MIFDRPVLFIIAPTNSGSSVLRELVEGIDSVAGIGEEGYNAVANMDENAVAVHNQRVNHRLITEWKYEIKDYKRWDPERYFQALGEIFKKRNGNLSQYRLLIEKSPANIYLIPIIRELFSDPKFLFLSRHPMAICEGISRRVGTRIGRAAEHIFRLYLDMTSYVEGFKFSSNWENYLKVTYEDLCDYPEEVKSKMGNWISSLGNIDLSMEVECHTIEGHKKQRLKNYNDMQIGNLSPSDRGKCRKKLSKVKGLLSEVWGYCLDP